MPEPKAAKNRLHFDLRASGPLEREVARLWALGARALWLLWVLWVREHLTATQDPEGDEFRAEPGPEVFIQG